MPKKTLQRRIIDADTFAQVASGSKVSTMKTIKVMRNIWGNWNAYEGSRWVEEIGLGDWLAVDWASERLLKGDCKLSDKSDVTQADVDAHRAKLA